MVCLVAGGLLIAVMLVVVNIVVDIIYGIIDPRVRINA